MNAVASMDSPSISCAAVAIALSATACIEQQTAERRPHPRSGQEPPGVATLAPEGSVAAHALHPARELLPGQGDRPVVATQLRASDEVPRLLASADGGNDTWEQVRHLMKLVPVGPGVSSLREFRRKLRRYHGNQRYFDQLGHNAQVWLYHVTRTLAARGVPGEIALLPAVESGYNAAAVSSRNAAGLWQILPGTARDLRLAKSWWYDARHDAVAATPAALDYLTSLHSDLNDDWLLAVAAYNCGPNNVRKAIRRAGLTVETADYAAIERYLPRETRGHMARWLVLSEIVAAPRLHRVSIATIPWRPYFAEIAVGPQTDMAVAARQSGISASEISLLNLGFRRGIVAPNGPHRLLVPAEKADRFGQAVVRVAADSEDGYLRYRIRMGDSLSVIAQAHGTTVKALMAANRLDSHRIRAGRELVIPGSPRRAEEPDRSRFDTRAVAAEGARRTPVAETRDGPLDFRLAQIGPAQRVSHERYRIRKGDSLSTIAQAHGTTVRALMVANQLSSHRIRVGRELVIPGISDRAAEVRPPFETHVVSAGESLWLIARLYRTTVDSLRDWNRLTPDSNLLRPGQRLRVRGEG